MDHLPSKSLDLLKQLEKDFPDTMITKELSPYEQGKLHGIIDLIRYLKRIEQEGQ